MAATGVTTLSAQDWHDAYRDRQEVRSDYRDSNYDYARANGLRADIARDRARMNEDIRCGRSATAARDAQDLARDQRSLNAQGFNIRHDRQDFRRDYREWR